MTECSVCGLLFAGTSAFDAHRVGKHAYLYSEGLRMDPPREDGRRCLASAEMAAAHHLVLDGSGQWRLVLSQKQLASLARLRQRRTTNSLDAIRAPVATSSLGTAA